MLDENSTSRLSKLTNNVFLPSIVISSMQIDYSNDMINNIILLVIMSIVGYALSIVIALATKYIFKNNKDLGIYQFAIVFSNCSFMGLPVVSAILGNNSIFYAAVYNLPFNIVAYTLGVYLLTQNNDKQSFKLKTLINPVIIAVVFGFILFITRIKLPFFMNRTFELLGSVTTPISMIVIGSMLCASNAFECFKNKKMYLMSFIRLILLPIIMFLLFRHIIHDPVLAAVPIIITGMPVAANTAILANEYGGNITLASQCVFMTTLFSVITIPLISYLLL